MLVLTWKKNSELESRIVSTNGIANIVLIKFDNSHFTSQFCKNGLD